MSDLEKEIREHISDISTAINQCNQLSSGKDILSIGAELYQAKSQAFLALVNLSTKGEKELGSSNSFI